MNSLLLKSHFKTLVMCFSTQSRNLCPTSSHFWPSETAHKIPHSRLKRPVCPDSSVRDTADTLRSSRSCVRSDTVSFAWLTSVLGGLHRKTTINTGKTWIINTLVISQYAAGCFGFGFYFIHLWRETDLSQFQPIPFLNRHNVET